MPSPAATALDAALEATVLGSFSKIGPALRRRALGWRDLDSFDLTGRTVLVTGANSGLGLATATQLAALGASLRITVRSDEKGQDTVRRITAETGNNDISYGLLDLTDLHAVHTFAKEFSSEHPTLDALVHNAGAMFEQRREVAGIEMTALVHVIAPTALTAGLLPSLRASDHPGRVVFVTSGGMYTQPVNTRLLQSPDDYKPATAYARAKRAQVVLTEQLNARLGGSPRIHAMHPGWAATPGVERSLPVFNKVLGPLLRSPEDGAETTTWLVASPEDDREGGQLWLDRRPRATARIPNTATPADKAMVLVDEILRLADVPADAFTPA